MKTNLRLFESGRFRQVLQQFYQRRHRRCCANALHYLTKVASIYISCGKFSDYLMFNSAIEQVTIPCFYRLILCTAKSECILFRKSCRSRSAGFSADQKPHCFTLLVFGIIQINSIHIEWGGVHTIYNMNRVKVLIPLI